MPGVLLCCLWHQAHRGAPCLGSYSVDQHVRHLKGHPVWVLLCSSVCQAFDGPASIVQLQMLACGERDTMVMAPPPTRDSAVSPCFHGCPAFLHRHFPARYPPSHPFDPSLCGQQQPSPWDCSTVPKLQLPATYIVVYVWLRQGLFSSQP